MFAATSTSSVLPSKYKLAECVGKRRVELSIIRRPRWSLPSAESTSHPAPAPLFLNRSLFTNGMSPLLSYSPFVPRKALIWHTARQEGGQSARRRSGGGPLKHEKELKGRKRLRIIRSVRGREEERAGRHLLPPPRCVISPVFQSSSCFVFRQ